MSDESDRTPPDPASPPDPATRARTDRIARRELSALLLDLFDEAGLERFVRLRLPGGDDLADEVTWQSGMADVTHQVAEQLQRSGGIDGALFDRLSHERPLRRPTVDALRTRLGLPGGAASAAEPAQTVLVDLVLLLGRLFPVEALRAFLDGLPQFTPDHDGPDDHAPEGHAAEAPGGRWADAATRVQGDMRWDLSRQQAAYRLTELLVKHGLVREPAGDPEGGPAADPHTAAFFRALRRDRTVAEARLVLDLAARFGVTGLPAAPVPDGPVAFRRLLKQVALGLAAALVLSGVGLRLFTPPLRPDISANHGQLAAGLVESEAELVCGFEGRAVLPRVRWRKTSGTGAAADPAVSPHCSGDDERGRLLCLDGNSVGTTWACEATSWLWLVRPARLPVRVNDPPGAPRVQLLPGEPTSPHLRTCRVQSRGASHVALTWTRVGEEAGLTWTARSAREVGTDTWESTETLPPGHWVCSATASDELEATDPASIEDTVACRVRVAGAPDLFRRLRLRQDPGLDWTDQDDGTPVDLDLRLAVAEPDRVTWQRVAWDQQGGGLIHRGLPTSRSPYTAALRTRAAIVARRARWVVDPSDEDLQAMAEGVRDACDRVAVARVEAHEQRWAGSASVP